VLNRTLDVINQAANNLSLTSSMRSDRELLQREFSLTVHLLLHACMRGMHGFGSSIYSSRFLSNDLQKIIVDYKEIWLSRNRSGGLKDSLAYFDISLNDYQ
jgi:hypothetical protein